MAEYEFVTYELLEEGRVARIMLNRPETRNAQNRGMLVELDDAFHRAEEDDTVRVVILGGVGPLFSSGHDMGSKKVMEELAEHPSFKTNGATRKGTEARMLQEWHYYFQNTLRWRNLRKITIAQVQGTVYAAGLMLMWACDLIVGADNVYFADVVGTRLGMCGVEYFGHPWEFGPRRTKELMLTGDAIDVHEAHRLGMVSKVFPVDELEEQTLAYARRIAELPTVSRALDQGVGQPDRGQHGLLQLAPGLLQPAPGEPRPLGRGPREQVPRGAGRGRHPRLAQRTARAPRRARRGGGPSPGPLRERSCTSRTSPSRLPTGPPW